MDRTRSRGRRVLVFIRSSPPSRTSRVAVKTAFAAHALLLLVRIEYSLLRRPLGKTCQGLGIELSRGSGTPAAAPMPWPELHRSAARAWRVMALWPFEDTCLRRCLLLGALLRDHRPELVVGVRRSDAGDVLAHSWLLIGGRSIDPTSPQYTALAST